MNIGFIGTGNMAKAIIKGMLAKNFCLPENIYCSARDKEKLSAFSSETGTTAMSDNLSVAAVADLLFLAVKPQMLDQVLPPLTQTLTQKKTLIISIAAGVTLATLGKMCSAHKDQGIIRVMPNVNAMIGQGVAALCANPATSKEESLTVKSIFDLLGTSFEIEEKDFSAFSAISGCSPAFTFLFIDALARGGVKNGLPKALATNIAAQTVLGSARMILESGKHPFELIDTVCSPAGTTIAGLLSLEEHAFLATVAGAVDASVKRDKELAG